MKLPALNPTRNKSTPQIIRFGGINRSMLWSSGELKDSRGLSSALFPALSQRAGRETLTGYTAPTSIFAKGKLCVVDGTNFLYDGAVKGTVTAGEKLFAAVNTKIVIFPDKKYYDTAADVFGDLECTYVSAAGTLTFAAGSIVTTGTAFAFKVGDGIKITGCTVNAANNKSAVVRAVSADGKTLTFDSSIFTAGTETGSVTLARSVPALENICEHDNRLWGTAGQTIYGSALGDPTNFNVFDGVSTDSYAVAVGSDGEFTGCAAYAAHICFFKENKIHKLYGTKPSNYQLDTYEYAGVMQGCSKSLVTINETLYFYGRAGVYAYYGGAPDLISEKFGARRYSDARAGTDGERYYISMQYDGGYELMIYDPLVGIWLKDGATQARDFCTLDGTLYMLGSDGIYRFGTGSEKVEWMAEFCPFTENTEGKKYITRLSLRLTISGTLKVEISCDNAPFEKIYTAGSSETRLVNVPVPIQRCDTFSLRLSGTGECLIQSMVRQVSVGSEV
jgi:hypothetical protein